MFYKIKFINCTNWFRSYGYKLLMTTIVALCAIFATQNQSIAQESDHYIVFKHCTFWPCACTGTSTCTIGVARISWGALGTAPYAAGWRHAGQARLDPDVAWRDACRLVNTYNKAYYSPDIASSAPGSPNCASLCPNNPTCRW